MDQTARIFLFVVGGVLALCAIKCTAYLSTIAEAAEDVKLYLRYGTVDRSAILQRINVE